MADDGDVPDPSTKPRRRPKIYHNPTGVIPQLPPGSRGPRSLYLKRHENSFGFTLRHLVIYPPDTIADDDGGRLASLGILSKPMDTIFVRNVKETSPAQRAGLQCGDRIVGVNRCPVTDKSYAEVVDLIQNSPEYLHLLVVPKEEDVLQRYFAETAYNPHSNLNNPEVPNANNKLAARHFLAQAIPIPSEPQVPPAIGFAPSSSSRLNPLEYSHQLPFGNELSRHDCNRWVHQLPAQPAVPARNRSGRRASVGFTFDHNYYDVLPSLDFSYPMYKDIMVANNTSKMKAMHKANYLNEGGVANQSQASYPNNAGCRLSLDAGRRESASSLVSSLVDGSKDSLSSSISTLTGHETDDSARMSRYRKSFQQKEEFLNTPVVPQQREFYSRPKKLDRPAWPPPGGDALVVARQQYQQQQESSRNATVKPTHHNFQRVKNDIENERDLLAQSPQLKNVTKSSAGNHFVFPGKDDEDVNGEGTTDDEGLEEKRVYSPTSMMVVQSRAREFESGRPLPADDPVVSNRMNVHKSELARISSKRVVPNVSERAQEFEILSNDPKRDISGSSINSTGSTSTTTTAPQKRVQRDTRSLESTDDPENVAIKVRPRSNSAESWVAALQSDKKSEGAGKRIISRQDAIADDDDHRRKEERSRVDNNAQLSPLIPVPVEHMHFAPSFSITPAAPNANSQIQKATRPTQLDLDGPVRPSRHLKPPTSAVDTPIRRPLSPSVVGDDKPAVVKRRNKNTNLAEDERTMRRESYLKATEGGRMLIDSDLSDCDHSPQAIRSAHRRWRPPMFPGDIQQLRRLFEDAAYSLGGSVSGNSSSSVSLDRDKQNASPILESNKLELIKEGPLHCKITGIDGKRFGDRSWKQIWAVLLGPKLFLHKDKHHHQSPMGSSDAVEHSLASGVEMRASMVSIPEDYTKRKHVFRVSSANPCRSEFLLQADNAEELADWVKALQEQVATATDVEEKFDPLNSKQQAVPQSVAASTSIQVQGSRLSPSQPQNKSKSPTIIRNRSPTGQSPLSKTRKPSQVGGETSAAAAAAIAATSPKSKTWRGRVAKQFRKMQGASSPTSPTAAEGSTFGIPLEQCLASLDNPYVPRFVEVCTDIVDARGLQIVGVYRVNGNNASITALTDEVNRCYDDVPIDDHRWNDVHVVSGLLKSYFRKMPESLVTNRLYPLFIKADKIVDPALRMKELRRLIRSLPPHNYHTLKHLVLHLRNVVNHCDVNKMEAKNLAIVFGPNIIRADEHDIESMVHNMTNQCRIVESLLIHVDWFFSDEADDDEETLQIPAIIDPPHEDPEVAANQALLLDNLGKYEALKDKEKNGALFSSIISAAQRKVKRKSTKGAGSGGGGGSLNESKEEVSPNDTRIYPQTDLKESTTTDGNNVNVIPTTVTEMEKTSTSKLKAAKNNWYNYSTDREYLQKRIRDFEQETKAMLEMPRNVEISVANSGAWSSAGNVHQQRFALKPADAQLLKTHSASNVFNRTIVLNNGPHHPENNRNSLDNSLCKVQYGDVNAAGNNNSSSSGDLNRNNNRKSQVGDSLGDKRNGRYMMRRGSSVENVNSSAVDQNANDGSTKKVKYENEGDTNQRSGSLDSLTKLGPIDDGLDLVADLTKLYDAKLQEEKHPIEGLLEVEGLPFADESPEKVRRDASSFPDSFRDPSLHKSPANNKERKLMRIDLEKDEDSSMINRLTPLRQNMNKLKRSESLNKPETTNVTSVVNNKVRRSESLNKTSDRLTKTEKTESNKRLASTRRSKDGGGKFKRKNGMPDRSIKRRHTVGGTKDPDKVTWLDNKNQEEVTSNKENKEKNLRTSSPDLSSARRERLLFEIMAPLRHQLISSRPQSFPEAFFCKVPLESHV